MHPVVRESSAWDGLVTTILGQGSELVSVSRYIGDSRVYRLADRVAKIRSRRAAIPVGLNSLKYESEVMRRLGRDGQVGGDADWEFLLSQWLNGESADLQLHGMSTRARLGLIGSVARAIRMLHREGVAHRDIRPENVLVRDRGWTELIDFDRAVICRKRAAFLADWIGIGPNGVSPYPFWKFVLVVLFPGIQSKGRHFRRLRYRENLPELGTSAAEHEVLRRAWRLGASSAANAPGQDIAYYAFTYKGVHYSGERPWYLRWEMIRRSVNFADRRVVELGCNLGLLASFVLIYGAKAAVGVDGDATVLDGARLVAKALGVQPNFMQLDLSRERDLRGVAAGDIVVVLSVLHWLADPKPVLEFIRRHDEVLFEGHDTTEAEIKRLESLGFEVRVIGTGERGRAILHGRKAR